MVKTETSKRFSFKGWDLKKWVGGNAKSIKIVITAIIALSAANPALLPISLSAGAGAIVTKAVLDIVQYWASEVQN
jgi:hypothetical protein